MRARFAEFALAGSMTEAPAARAASRLRLSRLGDLGLIL